MTERPASNDFRPGQATAARRAVVLARHRLTGDAEGWNAVVAEINDEAEPGQAIGQLIDAFGDLTASLAGKAFGATADATLARFANGMAQHEIGLHTGDDDD